MTTKWDDLKERLLDTLHDNLSDGILVCDRDWSAWSVGTMSENDFSALRDDPELLNDLVGIVSNQFKEAYDEMERYLNHIFKAGMEHAADMLSDMPHIDDTQRTALEYAAHRIKDVAETIEVDTRTLDI